MNRRICRCCGFESLIDPGERCPGCGYLFAYLNHQPRWTQRALAAAGEEIAIRRLRCAIVRQDGQRPDALADCTITNRGLRLSPCGHDRSERADETPLSLEVVLPYSHLMAVTPGTHMGRPARFFTYHDGVLGPLNLWFFVDAGVAGRQPDVDVQVKSAVEAFLTPNENEYGDAVPPMITFRT